MVFQHLAIHRLVVDYGREQEAMDVDVRAWRVTTVAFRLRGLGFLRGLSLEAQPERLLRETWRATFPDLALEEADWTAPD